MIKFIKYLFFIIALLVLNACATYSTQYKDVNNQINFPNKEIEHSFYLIGDAGNSPIGQSSEALQAFKKELTRGSSDYIIKRDRSQFITFLGQKYLFSGRIYIVYRNLLG